MQYLCEEERREVAIWGPCNLFILDLLKLFTPYKPSYNLSALCGLLLWPLVTVMVAPLTALPGLVWKLPLSCHWLVPSVFVDTGNRGNLFLHTSP